MALLIFKPEDMQACMDTVRDITEAFELNVHNGKGYPKSVDGFIWLIGEYLGKKVEISYLDLPAEGSSIKAMCTVWSDGTYRIYVLAGMTEDELRFVVCKELFHAIFDQEDRRNMDLRDHVEEYTSTYASQVGAEPQCSASWEWLAEIAAIEFLFPHRYRAEACNSEDTILAYSKAATQYGLPRKYVEIGCSESNIEYLAKFLPKD